MNCIDFSGFKFPAGGFGSTYEFCSKVSGYGREVVELFASMPGGAAKAVQDTVAPVLTGLSSLFAKIPYSAECSDFIGKCGEWIPSGVGLEKTLAGFGLFRFVADKTNDALNGDFVPSTTKGQVDFTTCVAKAFCDLGEWGKLACLGAYEGVTRFALGQVVALGEIFSYGISLHDKTQNIGKVETRTEKQMDSNGAEKDVSVRYQRDTQMEARGIMLDTTVVICGVAGLGLSLAGGAPGAAFAFAATGLAAKIAGEVVDSYNIPKVVNSI
ncbi:MAG: hypothetical protein FJZ58_07460 [Chlamydiae bacterium]|nr:hypothetical protein [Chlamydiota bacterium]